MTEDNHLLGKFDLTGIPPAPHGAQKIEISFDVDADGILNVCALLASTGKEKNITVTNDKGRLSHDEIDRMIDDAEKFKEEDKKNKERSGARTQLEIFVYNMKSTVDDVNFKGMISDSEKEAIVKKHDEISRWCDANKLAEVCTFF